MTGGWLHGLGERARRAEEIRLEATRTEVEQRELEALELACQREVEAIQATLRSHEAERQRIIDLELAKAQRHPQEQQGQ